MINKNITKFLNPNDLRESVRFVYVHLDETGNNLFIVATDGFRLIEQRVTNELLIKLLCVGFYHVTEWKQITKAWNEKAKPDKEAIEKVIKQVKALQELRNFTYPDYKMIMPKSTTELENITNLQVNRSYYIDFLGALPVSKVNEKLDLNKIRMDREKRMLCYMDEDLKILLMLSN